ncbi:tyrosine-type recombinase/integrase [Ligilactobacillus faecis]|uniref:tyrosine-type recombinase/integrase n=1 Tax=Ligilactobacillus faecis TaxID=762833 RepID=UPI00246925C6|nr:tyrosine-type recombinase/integrase [Ligilactobacillus faecis]WGN89822.1 tyrosine-type recombinase/integrase [Ligilactobacillus faecis]
MAYIKKYTKKDGSKAYMFKAYLGIDPLTGKERHTTRRGFRTISEAKTAISRLELEVKEDGLPTSQRKIMTFQELYVLWFEQYKTTIKESSAFSQRSNIQLHILPKFGKLKLDKISTAYCQKQVNNWFKTVKNYHNLIGLTRRILNYGKALKQISSNPMDNVIIPKRKDKTTNKINPNNFYDKQQLQTFMKTLEEHASFQMYVVFRVLAFTGIRKGELSALKWSDIDFKTHTLSIKRTVAFDQNGKLYCQTPKTKNSNRLLSLDKETVEILKKWQNKQRKEMFKKGINIDKEDNLVFHNNNGGFIQNSIFGFLNRFTTKYNLPPITPHGFRHTHASLLFESGATVKEVQERLGHENVKTTLDVYTHVTKSAREKTANKFAEYVSF